MSITTRCIECGATTIDGVLSHADLCSAAQTNSITLESRIPPIEIRFDTKAEQDKFMRQLSRGNDLVSYDAKAKSSQTNPPKETL